MVSLASLLNPLLVDDTDEAMGPASPSPTCSSRFTPVDGLTPPPTASRQLRASRRLASDKPKQTKDAPSFIKGRPKGEVRYPPYEDFEAEERRHMERWKLFPLGRIGMFARHIPYNSDKKGFQERTGRESFEGRRAVVGRSPC